MLEPLPATFAPTRDALHASAEHVLAPARYRADGHIGLIADARRVRHAGVRRRRTGRASTASSSSTSGRARRSASPITTLGRGRAVRRRAARRPRRGVHAGDDRADPDAPLAVDADAAARRSPTWLELGAALLDELRDDVRGAGAVGRRSSGPSTSTSRATSATRTPGPARTTARRPATTTIAEPYLYVGAVGREPAHRRARPRSRSAPRCTLPRARAPSRRCSGRGPCLLLRCAQHSCSVRPRAYPGRHDADDADVHPHGRVDRRAVGGDRQGDLPRTRAGSPSARSRCCGRSPRSPTGSRSTSSRTRCRPRRAPSGPAPTTRSCSRRCCTTSARP